MIDLNRRRFLGFLAAPAIVRATSLMPISVPKTLQVFGTIEGPPGLAEYESQLQAAIMREFSMPGPLYYTEIGIQRIADAVAGVELPPGFQDEMARKWIDLWAGK